MKGSKGAWKQILHQNSRPTKFDLEFVVPITKPCCISFYWVLFLLFLWITYEVLQDLCKKKEKQNLLKKKSEIFQIKHVRKYEWNRYIERGNMQTNANKWRVCYHLFYLNSKDVKFRSFKILIIVKNDGINTWEEKCSEDEDIFYNYHMHDLNILTAFLLLLWFFSFLLQVMKWFKP
jgi:hypothetical protein